jgi:hypothetical protein
MSPAGDDGAARGGRGRGKGYTDKLCSGGRPRSHKHGRPTRILDAESLEMLGTTIRTDTVDERKEDERGLDRMRNCWQRHCSEL